MQIVNLGDKGVILDELLLLFLSFNLDLIPALLNLLHKVVISANTVTQVHEEAIGRQFETTALLLDPLDCNTAGFIEATELVLASLHTVSLLYALFITFLEDAFKNLNLLNVLV